MSNLRVIFVMVGFAALMGVSGCVSSTLDPGVKTAAVKKPAKPPTYDPQKRAEAVAEIKEKAARGASDTKTNINDNGDGESKPLTKAEIAERKRELSGVGREQNGKLTDAELASKQRSIEELQKLSNNHYKDHVKKIEN